MNENSAIVIGYIIELMETLKVSGTFQKREVVIQTGEDGEEFRQFLKLEFVQSKCELLNPYKAGDKVQMKVNLNGRQWISPKKEVKYFNTLQGWAIELMEVAADPFPAADGPKEEKTNMSDDLPF